MASWPIEVRPARGRLTRRVLFHCPLDGGYRRCCPVVVGQHLPGSPGLCEPGFSPYCCVHDLPCELHSHCDSDWRVRHRCKRRIVDPVSRQRRGRATQLSLRNSVCRSAHAGCDARQRFQLSCCLREHRAPHAAVALHTVPEDLALRARSDCHYALGRTLDQLYHSSHDFGLAPIFPPSTSLFACSMVPRTLPVASRPGRPVSCGTWTRRHLRSGGRWGTGPGCICC